jgi:hypothetical protein
MVGKDYATARSIPTVSHWEDLIDQDEIDVGIIKGGSTQSFFEVYDLVGPCYSYDSKS